MIEYFVQLHIDLRQKMEGGRLYFRNELQIVDTKAPSMLKSVGIYLMMNEPSILRRHKDESFHDDLFYNPLFDLMWKSRVSSADEESWTLSLV